MAVSNWGYQADSDDEFVEGEDKAFGGGKSVLLMIVDCTPPMFESWKEAEDGEGQDDTIPFRAALKVSTSINR